MTARIASIFCYPVKGLNGESLAETLLTAGESLLHDRRYAVAHGSTRFDTDAPTWMPKTSFLTLMANARLALLEARFDPTEEILTLYRGGKQVVRAKLADPVGRASIEQFFAGFMANELRGAPKLVEAPGHSFSDAREKYLSIISLESVRDLERIARTEIDPGRFRGNIYLEGLPAWREFDWLGSELSAGETRLRIVGRIDRCAATNVNLKTAERDLNIPQLLRRGYGHIDMGVYAEVLAGGMITQGLELSLTTPG